MGRISRCMRDLSILPRGKARPGQITRTEELQILKWDVCVSHTPSTPPSCVKFAPWGLLHQGKEHSRSGHWHDGCLVPLAVVVCLTRAPSHGWLRLRSVLPAFSNFFVCNTVSQIVTFKTQYTGQEAPMPGSSIPVANRDSASQRGDWTFKRGRLVAPRELA